MKTQASIALVIDSQKKDLVSKDLGLERKLLDKLPIIDSFALIITGIRRCGKSTLLLQLMDKKYDNFLFLNFEDIRLAGFETSDFIRLNSEIEKRKVKNLFFDEIQLSESWEIFINQKLNEGYRIFITGSNATLLSKELGTHLTGRHLSVELFPFSFDEFLQYNQTTATAEEMGKYMQNGGIPEYVKSEQGVILQTLVDDILIKDIAIRYNIRDTKALRALTVFLISNIGKPISARSLSNTFGLKSATTITEYFSYLQDAYIIEFVPCFDYSIKKQIRNPKKVYASDLGIFNNIKTTFTDDLGRQLENLVFLHLRSKYKEIYYYKNDGVCDFVVTQNTRAIQCVQVCYQINDINLDRELKGLITALQYLGLKNGTIVTFDQEDHFEKDGFNVFVEPAHNFLLKDV